LKPLYFDRREGDLAYNLALLIFEGRLRHERKHQIPVRPELIYNARLRPVAKGPIYFWGAKAASVRANMASMSPGVSSLIVNGGIMGFAQN